MKRDSRRSTLLTLLAAFYLPLSLVTGIFGMNIKEFNEKAPPFYLCFEALFAIMAVTLVFLGLYRYLPLLFRRPKKRASPRRAERSCISQLCCKVMAPFCQAYGMFLELERRRQQLLKERDLGIESYKLDSY